MSKLKTRKTLTKRIKITKNGKVLRKSIRMGHLKVKLGAGRKTRKSSLTQIKNPEYLKTLRSLLGRAGKDIK